MGHTVEDIAVRIKTLRNRLQTAKRNMDKINERCLMSSDENQNEETQITSLFQKLQMDYNNAQEEQKRRLQKEESDLIKYEQDETKTITYSKEADQRLYEVEEIEEVRSIEEKIRVLEQEKEAAQAKLTTKLRKRDEVASEQMAILKNELEERRRDIQGTTDRLARNDEIFQKVFKELKLVSESHATNCRVTITSFLETYQEIASKVDGIDNGSKSGELMQDLSKLIEGSEANTNSVSNDSFVLEIPQVYYKASKDSGDIGHFELYTGEERPSQFSGGRSYQKGWYIENISGLSNQLIALVSRKKGSKETYLDIITQKGEQLTSHKVSTRNTDAFRFVCAVSPYRVATCCENDVNLMSIDNGTIEVSCKLNRGEEAWNICYNKSTSEILVGILGTNELRVFNETLTQLRTITMQNTSRAPLSLAASGDNVFVCTYENRAFVLDGEKGTVKTTFHRNGAEKRAWRICSDSLDMVYVMWLRSSGVITVTRYSLLGVPLSSLDADCNVRFLSFALIQNGSEQLILATEEGEFYLHRTVSNITMTILRLSCATTFT